MTGAPLRAADGVALHHHVWTPDAPSAALLVSHGLGEHGGRYARLATELLPRGVATMAVDHRGHGRSEGPRGHADAFRRLTDDLERRRAHFAASLPGGVPMFLLGHSLGGLVALRHLQEIEGAPYRGAILSAPLLGVAVEAPRWKTGAAGLLSRLLPRLAMGNEIDPALLSGDPAYVADYRSDPLVHDRITPRLYTEFLAAIPRVAAEADRLRLPLLFLVPGADRVCRSAETLRLARSLPGDVEVREYPGFAHESLNERQRDRAVADVAAWMDARRA